MAEMLIQSESLTSIADKIRVLSGTEEAMSLNVMENHVDEANLDVATEADLIEQIASALEGKAGGSDGGNIETCTVILKHNGLPIFSYYATAFTETDGVFPLTKLSGPSNPTTLSNIVCGSVITLSTANPILFGYSVTNGAELIDRKNSICIFSIPQQPNGDVTITVREDD